MAISIHFEQNGKPFAMLLDIDKVPKSHMGLNLVLACIKVLEDFGINDNIRAIYWVNNNRHLPFQNLGCNNNVSNYNSMIDQLGMHLLDFPGTSNQTRCLLHILKITAKFIIEQFDISKTRNNVVLDQVAQAKSIQKPRVSRWWWGQWSTIGPVGWPTQWTDRQRKEEIELNVQAVQTM